MNPQLKLRCVKGIATDYFVVCVQGDVVEVVSVDENEIEVKGWAGWCKEHNITLTAKEIANHFCFYGD